MTDEERAFEEERGRLQLLAYRMLGSWHDAEDVLQEVALDHLRAAPGSIDHLPGWLTRTTVRRSIDALRRRSRWGRDAYPGPWLPEPLVTPAEDDPAVRHERDETLSLAFLHAAERLSPPQRATIVLRSLGYAYEEVAAVLDLTVAACRQHHTRGARRLAEARSVVGPDAVGPDAVRPDDGVPDAHPTAEVRSLLRAFLRAARDGDAGALERLLHEDVVAYNDGGGRTRAALRPVRGRDAVARFALGLAERHRGRVDVRAVTVNGEPGLHLRLSGVDHVVAVDVVDGRIASILDVCNPDKLVLGPSGSSGAGG